MGSYKIISHDLQRSESNLIYNIIIKKMMDIYPEIKVITVHDSIIVQSKYKDIIHIIFKQKLNEK